MLAHTQIQTGRHCDVLERTSFVNVQGDLKLQNIYIYWMRKNGINLRKFCCTIKQNRKGRIGIDREIDEFTTRERVISFIFFVCAASFFFLSILHPLPALSINTMIWCLNVLFRSFLSSVHPFLRDFLYQMHFQSLSLYSHYDALVLKCSISVRLFICFFLSSLCWNRMGFPFAILLCLIFSFAIFFCSNTIVFSICVFCIILSRKFFILQSFDASLFPYCDDIMTIPYCCEIFSHFATKLYSVHPSAHFDLFAIYFSRIRLDNVDEISKIRLQFERERKENVIEKSTKCIWTVFYRFHVQSKCNELYLLFLFHLRHI